MTEETAFEKWWNNENSHAYYLKLNGAKEIHARIAWNAAIDAAMARCEYLCDEINKGNVIAFGPGDETLGCKSEIQKLRSE